MPRQPRPPKNLGVLASIDLTISAHDIFSDIEDGYGANRKAHHINVARGDIKAKKNDLIDQGCEIIATIGGLYVNAGVEGDANNVPFVSLVGEIPTLPPGSKCAGGVSLETVSNNEDRIQHLLGKLGQNADRSMIALFRPRPDANQTQVSQDEQNSWGTPNIINSDGNFQQEFNGIDPQIKGVVVSASPLFLFGDNGANRNNMGPLVRAANSWLNDQSRFIVYPLQIYKEANPAPRATPATGGIRRITFFGPDFHDACVMLGAVARLAQTGASPGFLKRADAASVTES